MEAVKQGMMKNVAQWTSNIFGEQAANAIFQVGGGPAVANGALQQGTISLTSGAASVMSAVMTAYTVYALISVLVEILFACSESEQELQVRKALRSTHEIGTWCSTKILGKCVKRKTGYCMFNSPLARIMNEQARLQLNIPWGPPENPDCRGITLAEFQNLDMERVDLSEWTGMLAASGMLDMSSTNIESMTGVGSTLGRAQEDLYPRENAIDRNLNRIDGIDLDGLRNDAVNDFGMGVVQ
ncbi:conjugal transfer protein TraN [Falsigemmobacter intermedius]|uniref:conjugal transfer protein TraN n=1 Tax=Falsigemmobacter intermedius TaxID=1553448 RepID=UPI003F012338